MSDLPGWRRLRPLPAIGVVAVLTLPACYFAMFSGFANWDDEGYVLIALRAYARGGALYEQVYSEYGPAFFQLLNGLFGALHAEFHHTTGRLFTLLVWAATPALCAVATYRVGRNLVVALCAQMLVFWALWPLRVEPPHPGGLLTLLLGGLTVAGSFLDTRAPLAAAAIGVLAALALLTKINVGGFIVAAAVCSLLAGARVGRRSIVLAYLAGAGVCLIPPVLMSNLWSQDWVRVLCVVVTSSVGAVVLMQLSSSGTNGRELRDLLVMLLAFAITAMTSCLIAHTRGTTFAGLARGIVLNPLNHPSEFSLPLELPSWAPWYASASLSLAACWVLLRRAQNPIVSAATAPLQLIAGAVIWLVAAEYLPLSRFAASLPLLWVALTSSSERGEALARGESFLVSLAVLQTLHVYPVAGTHQSWSTFLYVPVGALALAKGWRGGAAAMRRWLAAGELRWARADVLIAALLLAATFRVAIYRPSRQARWFYKIGVPLNLPGAESIRLSPDEVTLYHWLVSQLSSRCTTFITLPGLNSLYFFTGIEPPTGMNMGHWMTTFSAAQQIAVRDRFAQIAGPHCVVRNRTLADGWARGRDYSAGPLVRYIDDEFVTIATRGDYELMAERAPP